MPVTPSKRFINWTACTFTPAGGTAIPIPGITQCSIDRGIKVLTDSSDADYYDSFAVAVSAAPKLTLTTNKPGALDLISDGAIGVISIQRNDAQNGATPGGGAMVYTLHCIYDPGAQAGGHRQLGTGQATFTGFSVDGITNPLAVTAL